MVRGSRLDQVCVDVPPSAFDREVAFWSGLLDGWASRPGALPEFHVVEPPPGLPVRLLLQRLGEEHPASAHLDLACADVPATRARHEELGAAFVAGFPGWTVMRDPAGGTYRLTTRDPETGGLRGAKAAQERSPRRAGTLPHCLKGVEPHSPHRPKAQYIRRGLPAGPASGLGGPPEHAPDAAP